ncbi:hypothetical protein [Schleiferilactobacillus harbinensis]|uniref:hypothetical protein n=1 Tax=Schleiferilactobacillus harbinensis TaxID=304207 RepID=UPI0039E73AA1
MTWLTRGLLLPILFGMVILTLGGNAQAVTMCNLRDNTGPTAPADMYTIPGLGRARQKDEGSYVKSGTGSSGTPITNGTTGAWASKTTESPTIITFPATSKDHGDSWFSINYVNKNDFIDFIDAQQANQFYVNGRNNYNANNVESLMGDGQIEPGGLGGPVLKDGQSFDGGFLQVTGNVPISAKIAKSKTSVDAVMAGNWGVMVRVTLPEGIDAKSLGGAIDWGKSYFYLTLDSINVVLLGQIKNLNFPLQFDHHVYLDDKKTNVFYLKVKGIPFKYDIPDNQSTALMQLQRGTADYLDYLHNRYIDNGIAHPLDNLEADGDTDTVGSGENIQPKFVIETGGKNTVWDPFYGLAYEWGGLILGWIAGIFSSSPVYATGNVGRTLSLLNAADPSSNRAIVSSGSIGGWLMSMLVSPVLSAISSYFVTSGFEGSAHINFSFDMSKYTGDQNKAYQAITGGRMLPAPYADGRFNKGTTLGTNDKDDKNRRAIGISLYGSNTLLDPYSVLAGKDRSKPNDDLLNQLKAGTSPLDYAVIDESKLDLGTTNPDQTDVRDFPVYTNFTSWTAFVSPFDNSKTVDTLHSSGDPLGSDMRARTATPNSYSDGILVNDGQPFTVDQNYTTDDYAPTTKSATDKTLVKAGGITPERYAQVYQYYDYSGATPVPNPTRVYTTTDNALSLNVATDTNAPLKYNGKITKGFPDNTWVYAGKYNVLPVAGTSLALNQDIRPEMNLTGDQIYVLDKSQLINDKTLKEALGTWRDRLTIGTDTMTITTYPIASDTALGTATTDQLVPSADLHDIDLHLGDSVNYGFEGDPPYGDLTAGLTIPPVASTDNGFYGLVKLSRNADVPINVKTATPTLDAGSADLANNANFLVLLRDDTDGASWTAEHHYTDSASTIHFFYQNGDQANVGGTVKNTGDISKQTFQIMIPRVTGTTISNLAVTAPDGSAVPEANITKMTSNTDLDKYYQRYLVKMPSLVIKDQAFTFSYTYQASDIANMPESTTLQTVIGDENGKVLARTGNLYLKRMKTVAILQVPQFDFGKQTLPKSEQQYGLTDDSKKLAQLVIQDNSQANNTGALSWRVTGRLSAFANPDASEAHTDFKLDLGLPTMPADYQYPTDPDLKAPIVANHTPETMLSNNVTQQLFFLNRVLESTTDATPLTLTYADAKLTVPNTVVKSGKYESTVTYTVKDGL